MKYRDRKSTDVNTQDHQKICVKDSFVVFLPLEEGFGP